jgi:hypothetical protein
MSASDKMISVNKEDFLLTDDHGREWQNLGFGTQANCPDLDSPSILIKRLPLQNWKMSLVIWYSEDFKALGVSEVTLSVKGVFNGVTAVWKAPIH